MSRPQPVTIAVEGRTGYVSPAGPAVRGAVQRLRLPSQWFAQRGALGIPAQSTDDLAAALEHGGLRVTVTRPPGGAHARS
jgi:hypothetical protein